jgi:transcriptional regulator with XRE-family HTH domain
LVGLSQADVAVANGLSLRTVVRAESDREVMVSNEEIAAICQALEAAGVEFTSDAPLASACAARWMKATVKARWIESMVPWQRISAVRIAASAPLFS